MEVLGSNLEDLRRLSGIVHDMLFLSHADRGAKARRTAPISLASLATDVIDYHDAALEEAHLEVEVIGDAWLEVDAALVRRALSNLIGIKGNYFIYLRETAGKSGSCRIATPRSPSRHGPP